MPILTRYQAAVEVATEQRKQEILATPIDDAGSEIDHWRAARNAERNELAEKR